jgi:L-ascorbate metabolism protein UlaG (beta-lactamase superfamily)
MSLLQKARRQGKRFLNPVPTSVGSLSTIFKVLPRYLSSKEERTPTIPLGPFTTDPRTYQSPPATGLRITWFGHSSSLVEIDGLRVLIDPVWDERAAPVQWAGPKRFFSPTIPLHDLPPIDVILISHDHYDHLGAGTVRTLAGMPALAHTRWITALGVGSILTQFGLAPSRWTELNWTDNIQVPGSSGDITITALPGRHFSGRSLRNRFHTLWASFAITGPRHRLYYGADSGEWPGFRDIGTAYGPFDLSMLEIGAFDPLWADIHMGPDGAARTFLALGGSGLLMPIHWGLFDLALHAWRQPIERLSSIADLKLWSPAPGEPTDVLPNQELRSRWWQTTAPDSPHLR